MFGCQSTMWWTSLLVLLILSFPTGGSFKTEVFQEIMKKWPNESIERSKRSQKSVAHKCATSTPNKIIMCLNEISGSAGFADGDMKLKAYQERLLRHSHRRKRKVLNQPISKRWDPKRIPYKFHSSVNSEQKKEIESAIKIWEDKTCLHFEHKGKGRDYMFFRNKDGCNAWLGRMRGRNAISIGYLFKDGSVSSCGEVAMVHEIGHSLGFTHEHNRPDRDKYVKILWKNIEPKRKTAFYKYEYGDLNTLGKEYDFHSIMHYSDDTWSKKGKPTMVPVDPKNSIPEYNSELTESDVEQINKACCTHMLKVNSYIVDSPRYNYDCVLGPWSSWSKCKKPCGEKYRTREIESSSAGNGRCASRKQSSSCKGCKKGKKKNNNKKKSKRSR